MNKGIYIDKKDIRTMMSVICQIRDLYASSDIEDLLNATHLDYDSMEEIVTKGLDFNIDI